jgi:hypothetical protein
MWSESFPLGFSHWKLQGSRPSRITSEKLGMALHIACYISPNETPIQLLLDPVYKININTMDELGNVPLHTVWRRGHSNTLLTGKDKTMSIMQQLLQHPSLLNPPEKPRW